MPAAAGEAEGDTTVFAAASTTATAASTAAPGATTAVSGSATATIQAAVAVPTATTTAAAAGLATAARDAISGEAPPVTRGIILREGIPGYAGRMGGCGTTREWLTPHVFLCFIYFLDSYLDDVCQDC
jgi:hypothetical protein